MKLRKLFALLLCISVILSSTACVTENTSSVDSRTESVTDTTTATKEDKPESSDSTPSSDSEATSTTTDSVSETPEDNESSVPATEGTTTTTGSTKPLESATDNTTTTKPVTSTTTTKPETSTTTKPITSTTPEEKPTPSVAGVYEAEQAVLIGLIVENNAACSGKQMVGNWNSNSCYAEFTVAIAKDGMYDLIFTSSGIGGTKENNVIIDDVQVGTFKSAADKFTDTMLTNILLKKGTHKVKITKSWGWMYLDKLTVAEAEGISDSTYNVTGGLINKNATTEAMVLYEYLKESYGNVIISGQVCDGGISGNEFQIIKSQTGKYPAMLGLDMMRYTPSRTALGDNSDAVEKAIEFDSKGGIVTFCWHWNAPTEYLKPGTDPDNNSPRWWGGFYSRNSDIDLSDIMDGKDKKGKELLDRDIKAIAQQLLRLQDAGVPVLWRPLHEASGGWFWWGADGADAYKKLWIYLYDQLTNVYHCNNLIWVNNCQNADWYPGDEYCDIVGEDIYPGRQITAPQTSKFCEALDYTGKNKITALTENGCIFDIDAAVASNTMWAWFCTWCGEFVTSNNFSYSEAYTTTEILKKAYSSDYVITLDELPKRW